MATVQVGRGKRETLRNLFHYCMIFPCLYSPIGNLLPTGKPIGACKLIVSSPDGARQKRDKSAISRNRYSSEDASDRGSEP